MVQNERALCKPLIPILSVITEHEYSGSLLVYISLSVVPEIQCVEALFHYQKMLTRHTHQLYPFAIQGMSSCVNINDNDYSEEDPGVITLPCFW